MAQTITQTNLTNSTLNGMKQLMTLLCLSSLLVACSTPANVSYASDQESLQKLTKLQRYLSSRGGYSCRKYADGMYRRQGDSYTVYTTLHKGNEYLLVGAGNVHVKDLDVLLHDENHNEIAQDDSKDSIPMVRVSPKWTGRFHAKVKMHHGKGYSNLMVCYR